MRLPKIGIVGLLLASSAIITGCSTEKTQNQLLANATRESEITFKDAIPGADPATLPGGGDARLRNNQTVNTLLVSHPSNPGMMVPQQSQVQTMAPVVASSHMADTALKGEEARWVAPRAAAGTALAWSQAFNTTGRGFRTWQDFFDGNGDRFSYDVRQTVSGPGFMGGGGMNGGFTTQQAANIEHDMDVLSAQFIFWKEDEWPKLLDALNNQP